MIRSGHSARGEWSEQDGSAFDGQSCQIFRRKTYQTGKINGLGCQIFRRKTYQTGKIDGMGCQIFRRKTYQKEKMCAK
jgi:hypothetical protein